MTSYIYMYMYMLVATLHTYYLLAFYKFLTHFILIFYAQLSKE